MVLLQQRYSVSRMILSFSLFLCRIYPSLCHTYGQIYGLQTQANKKKVTNLNAYGQFDLTTHDHTHTHPCFNTCLALDRSLTDGDLTSSYTRLWSGRGGSLPKLFLSSFFARSSKASCLHLQDSPNDTGAFITGNKANNQFTSAYH